MILCSLYIYKKKDIEEEKGVEGDRMNPHACSLQAEEMRK